jgi:hypothetical protein
MNGAGKQPDVDESASQLFGDDRREDPYDTAKGDADT